jgi:hypothetical protein
VTKHKSAICIALIALVGLWLFSSYAEKTAITLSDFAVIVPEGQSVPRRVLFRVSLPDGLDGKQIDFAELSFDIASLPGPYLEIEVYPLACSWEAQSVTWSSPWQNPGGDYDETDVVLVAIAVEGSVVKGHADVSDIVRSWVDGDRTNHGIILVCSKEFPGDFQLELGNQRAPVELEVKYSERD